MDKYIANNVSVFVRAAVSLLLFHPQLTLPLGPPLSQNISVLGPLTNSKRSVLNKWSNIYP